MLSKVLLCCFLGVTVIVTNGVMENGASFVYEYIQSISSSEMCSLHLTHPSAHTWNSGGPSGEQSGVRCLAQGSHISRGQFLPGPRFEPTTSSYKTNALSTRATTAPQSELIL